MNGREAPKGLSNLISLAAIAASAMGVQRALY